MQRLKTKEELNDLREVDKGSLSDKSGFSVFCGASGCGFVIPTANGRCPSCKERIVRESTYESTIKLFSAILETNRHVFNSHVFTEYEKESLFYLVNIGRVYYWVPFRYFIELENLERTDRSQMDNFIEYIKKHCKTYKP